MQAIQDADALDVLVDALLEAEWFELTWHQEHLRESAMRWARAVVSELFKEYWGTDPWMGYEARVDPGLFWGINREVDPTRLAGMRYDGTSFRDRVRQLTNLRDAEILSDEEVQRLVTRAIADIG
jgi:hypothetical protein